MYWEREGRFITRVSQCLSWLFLSGDRQDRMNQKLMVFRCSLSWSRSTSLHTIVTSIMAEGDINGWIQYRWNQTENIRSSAVNFVLNFPEEKRKKMRGNDKSRIHEFFQRLVCRCIRVSSVVFYQPLPCEQKPLFSRICPQIMCNCF